MTHKQGQVTLEEKIPTEHPDVLLQKQVLLTLQVTPFPLC